MAEYGDQQEDLHQLPGNEELLLAEVDLHLPPGCGFEADRRDCGCVSLAALTLDGALDRPDARIDALATSPGAPEDAEPFFGALVDVNQRAKKGHARVALYRYVRASR